MQNTCLLSLLSFVAKLLRNEDWCVTELGRNPFVTLKMDDLCLLSQFYQWRKTVTHFSINWKKLCHRIQSFIFLNVPHHYFTRRLAAEMQPRPSIMPHCSHQKVCKNLLEPKALKFPRTSGGDFSAYCAWLCKNEILQLPTKSLCDDFWRWGGKGEFLWKERAKMFFQEYKEQPFVWTCFGPMILTSLLFWFLGQSFRCPICPLKGLPESSLWEPRSQPCRFSDWQNQRWPSDLLLRDDEVQCLTSASPMRVLPVTVNKRSLKSYCPYFPFAADVPAEVFLVIFHVCHKIKIKYF